MYLVPGEDRPLPDLAGATHHLEDAGGEALLRRPLVEHEQLGAVVLDLLADVVHLVGVGLDSFPSQHRQPLVLSCTQKIFQVIKKYFKQQNKLFLQTFSLLRIRPDHVEEEFVPNVDIIGETILEPELLPVHEESVPAEEHLVPRDARGRGLHHEVAQAGALDVHDGAADAEVAGLARQRDRSLLLLDLVRVVLVPLPLPDLGSLGGHLVPVHHPRLDVLHIGKQILPDLEMLVQVVLFRECRPVNRQVFNVKYDSPTFYL